MRPIRLMMEGFGSYRERTEVDLSDADFFVLTGPTGAGKSTVIDALCFALYGTVPRWGKGNVIKDALAPSTTECQVCLVFEAAGERYAAVRVLRRDARGAVHTKLARLDRLGGTVAPDAELDKLLDDVPESLVDGPDQMLTAVTELLGIGYEHFTQCVLLPQGRFAEFLHAKPSDRQDLLTELLALAVYEQVGQRARERAQVAAGQLTIAQRRLAELGEVTAGDIDAADERVTALETLAPQVDSAVAGMAELRARWTEANRRATEVRGLLANLTALRMPDGVAALAADLDVADERVRRCTEERDRLDAAEADAERECAALPDPAVLQRWFDGHSRDAALRAELDVRREACERADAEERDAGERHAGAEHAIADAERALAAAEQAHRAVALAADVTPGEPCPVCRQLVGAVPHHDVPADLGQARAAVVTTKSTARQLGAVLAEAGKGAAAARSALAAVERQLGEVVASIADAPTFDDVKAALKDRAAAEADLRQAKIRARAARAELAEVQRDRAALQNAERSAWSALREARDGFITLHAPAVDGTDLALGWRTLLDWATDQRGALTAQAAQLDGEEAELRAAGTKAAAELRGLLAEHGVPTEDAELDRAPVTLASHLAGARRDLDDLRSRRDQAAALTTEVAKLREQSEVAGLLGNLLRSNGFERWLCAEALDSLVFEASGTLMQLSGGQYELDRGERNELVVVDHNDAGTRRPVNTLSGGETFQASLALALALSRQVVGLSAGRRSLDSMFLDEGFGTLDEATLDTVASTLERLAGDSDRMVGIVTHVPALAERVPVQFAVTRDGASSRLRRV